MSTEPIVAPSIPSPSPSPEGLPEHTRTDQENILFKNRFVTFKNNEVTFPTGAKGTHAVLTSGTGLGVLTVARYISRGIAYYSVVEQYRYPLGKTMIEFPRGGSDSLDASEAARELVEETGAVASEPILLGVIHPDSGVLDTSVAIWMVSVKKLPSSEVRDDGGVPILGKWLDEGRIMGKIRNGEISCGLTLAAWALYKNSSYSSHPW